MLNLEIQSELTILFVCKGNTCRSPIAKALMQQKYIGSITTIMGRSCVDSAGTHIRPFWNSLNPQAFKVLAMNGCALEDHKPRQIEESDFYRFSHIICMDKNNLEYVLEMKPKDSNSSISMLGESTEILDPYGKSFEIYQESFNVISEMLFCLVNQWIVYESVDRTTRS